MSLTIGVRLDLPVPLTDGKHFLYLDHFTLGESEQAGIYVGALDEGPDEQPAQLIVAATDGPILVHESWFEKTTLL